MPPRLSPSFAAASISAIILASAAGSAQRTGDSSMRARSSGSGRCASADAPPIPTTCEMTDTPSGLSNALASAPAATRATVSRALARSSTSRASLKPYFCIPVRSACPGRGWVSGFFVAPGCGDISSCHTSLRNHSVFLMRIDTGDPRVRPWRMPPSNSISSCSKRCRGPRPKPSRRRANSPEMSPTVIGRCAGRPSTTTTRA